MEGEGKKRHLFFLPCLDRLKSENNDEWETGSSHPLPGFCRAMKGGVEGENENEGLFSYFACCRRKRNAHSPIPVRDIGAKASEKRRG